MQITGKAILRNDGLVLRSENGATLSSGGFNRESERHGGQTYFKENDVSPSVDMTLLHDADADITTLRDIKDATVEFECDTGQIYILRGAFVTEPPQLDSGTGKITLKMEANSCDKI